MTNAFIVAATLLCMFAAQRMAYRRARSQTGWMLLAALLGPLPLAALALLRRRD